MRFLNRTLSALLISLALTPLALAQTPVTTPPISPPAPTAPAAAPVLPNLGPAPTPTAPNIKSLPIRVLVGTAASLKLIFPAAHSVLYSDGTVLLRAVGSTEWRLSAIGNSIAIQTANGVFNTQRDRLYFDAPEDGLFKLDGRGYRGRAAVIARGGQLLAINQLNVEEYVRGVIPREMPTSFALEALKAQAVIARTYAIANLKPGGDYDLCDTPACQVYGGADAESPITDQAAQATRGIIGAYGGKPAVTYFSADSGGYTATANEVWGGQDLPYLQARPDPASKSPKSPWKVQPNINEVRSDLAQYAPEVGDYISMQITARTASGRVEAVFINGTNGQKTLSGMTARNFIVALGAQSTLASVTSTQPLILEGTGWGHGVGMSQWGAHYLALKGWTYDQLLGYYYPGMSLANYEVK
jgi:stage II sporulation protein D